MSNMAAMVLALLATKLVYIKRVSARRPSYAYTVPSAVGPLAAAHPSIAWNTEAELGATGSARERQFGMELFRESGDQP